MSNLLEYRNYHGAIEFSDEDGMLIGHVIGVNDSLNFHGFSIDEITQAFRNCIDSYLDMCEEFGRNPDKEYKGSLNVRIGSDLHRRADIAAKKEGISINQFIQSAIQDALEPRQNSSPTYILIDKEMYQLAVSSGAGVSQQDQYTNLTPISLTGGLENYELQC